MHTQPELAMKEEGWDTVGYFFFKKCNNYTLIEKNLPRYSKIWKNNCFEITQAYENDWTWNNVLEYFGQNMSRILAETK